MSWILLGYYPKHKVPAAPVRCPAPVVEICSVSHCIARRPGTQAGAEPPNWFDSYDSPAAAWRAVATDLQQEVAVFAYRLAPLLFRDGWVEELELSPPEVVPLPDTFERLGYDAVEFTGGFSLGCSPLSCNSQTEGVALNRYCLVETEQEGIDLARAFSLSKPEPGPYVVAEVWRDRHGPA